MHRYLKPNLWSLPQALRSVISLCFLLVISSNVLADLHLKEYWMVDEFFKANPEQLERSEAFNLRVQSQPKRLINNTDSARILVIYPGLQTSDYWRRSIHAFEHRLKQLGIRYQLDVHFTKPGSDLNLQAKLLTQSLGDTTDYLVFTLDAIKHQKLIEQVKHQTQTKIILQNITTPLRAFSKQQPFLYVGFDHAIGTQLLVQEYQTRFPQGANYGILFGTQGYVSKIRGGLFESQMRAAHNFHLKDSYYVDFDRAKAKAATLQLIKDHHQPDANTDTSTNTDTNTNKLDFIYATSTDIALGALDALKELGLEQDIQINGWGGGSSELNSLKAKELSFTVMRMNDDNGVAMAEAIGLDLLGKSDQVPTIYSGSFRLVDQTIKPKQLNRFESRAFRYSNLSSETH